MPWPLSFSTVRTCVGGFSTLTPHSNELFRAGGMRHRNAVVEVSLIDNDRSTSNVPIALSRTLQHWSDG